MAGLVFYSLIQEGLGQARLNILLIQDKKLQINQCFISGLFKNNNKKLQ